MKISYLKYRLSQILQGYYGNHRGYRAIYITHDPTDNEINNQHKRIIKLDSKQGQLIRPIIEESMRLQSELEYLESKWRIEYNGEPRIIKYPLKRLRQPPYNSEFFKNAKINSNTYKPEALKIIYKGQKFRTKNELSAAQVVESLGYEYKSEIHIAGDHYDHYPDVSVNIPELDLMLMSEIDGAMERSNYKLKSIERQYEYFDDGFCEFKDIVFLRMTDSQVFDPEAYKTLIRTAIEVNINDLFTD